MSAGTLSGNRLVGLSSPEHSWSPEVNSSRQVYRRDIFVFCVVSERKGTVNKKMVVVGVYTKMLKKALNVSGRKLCFSRHTFKVSLCENQIFTYLLDFSRVHSVVSGGVGVFNDILWIPIRNYLY
jgi:hypothetical protein